MSISGLYQKYTNQADHLVLNLEIALILSGLVCILLNAITFKYSGDHYLSFNWLWTVPLLVTGFFSTHLFKLSPNAAFLIRSYSLYFLAFFAFLVMLNGVQYTPFPTMDHFVATADRALHVQETALIDWAYVHPYVLNVLQICYKSVVIQWLLMPLLLFWLKQKNQFYFYLTASLLAYLMGTGIYYFFPTLGPASIFSDAHFTQSQLDTVINFKEIHQYLMVTTFDGGMIAFPSFHVLWSVIIIFTLRKTPAILWAPVLLLNVTAIVATLFLGWNYAVDIACGIVVAGVAIKMARRMLLSRLFNNT